MALYVLTLAPDVAGADTGEFQFVPYVLGIAHPPGYPLYTLLGRAFCFLPFGSVAYRMNFMSAFFAAATVSLTYLTAMRAVRWIEPSEEYLPTALAARLAAVFGAAVLAVSATWWSQSVVAAVRTLNGFFIALCLLLVIQWSVSRQTRWLYWLALAVGLGLTHHSPSVGTAAAGLVIFILAVDWRVVADLRRLASLLGLVIAPLGIYLYLPIRSLMGAPFDPARPTTVESFLSLVTARGFAGDMLHYGLADLPQRLDLLGQLEVLQFGWIGLGLAAVGFVGASVQRWRLALLLLLVGASNAFVSITYRAPVIADYLIPSYLVLALCAALGVWTLGYWPSRWLSRVASRGWYLAAVVGVLSLTVPWQTLQANFGSLDLSRYTQVRDFAEGALRVAEPGSTILADWHDATALWYCQMAEGLGRDVNVVYVYPEGEKVPWAEKAGEYLQRGPVYVTDYHSDAAASYRLRPVGPLLQVLTGPDYSDPAAGTFGGYIQVDANLDDKVMLLGYSASPSQVPPGDRIRVTLFWRALQDMDRSYTVFVHLTTADGKVWGQHDGYPGGGYRATAAWEPGEVVADEHELVVWPDTPPGTYTIAAGMYEVPRPGEWRRLPVVGSASRGQDAVTLGQVTVTGRSDPITSPQFECDYPLGDRVRLIGYDVNRWSGAVLELTLYWKALQPMADDRWVSLTFVDATGAEVGRETSKPVSGMCPTNRWAAGETVIDRHLVNLARAPTGDLTVQVRLAVSPDQSDRDEATAAVSLPGSLNDPGRVRINFANKALLTGWSVEPRAARAGGQLRVELAWEPLGSTMEDCSVFVHVLGSDGRTIGQHDGVPVDGGYPTLRWVRGRVVRDSHTISLPSDAQAGQCSLEVGVYAMRTGQRWPVLDRFLAEEGQSDRVLLGQVIVTR